MSAGIGGILGTARWHSSETQSELNRLLHSSAFGRRECRISAFFATKEETARSLAKASENAKLLVALKVWRFFGVLGCTLPKLDVRGSNPLARSRHNSYRSLSSRLMGADTVQDTARYQATYCSSPSLIGVFGK